MFTNMLTHHHHHRPGSPMGGLSASSIAGSPPSTGSPPEQKYAPLHNAADAMRRHCMPSPVTYSGNLFAGFDETFLARAEALAAVDYPGKNQFKPESTVSGYYPMGAPPPHHMPPQAHHAGMGMGPGSVHPPPVYGAMPPPPGIHHPSPLHTMHQGPLTQGPLSITDSGADLMEQLSNPSHCSSFSTYQPPSFSASSGMMPTSESGLPGFNTQPPSSMAFHPGVAMATPASSASSDMHSQQHNGACSPPITHPSLPVGDYDTDPRELEAFAERFKQRRIKLGVTQCDVGQALAKLKLPGVGSLSQSTICRFESLTLSHNNMVALKPILMTWLEQAEAEYRRKMEESGLAEKKRKRTSIAAPEKRSLEAYFSLQPRPSSEKIAAIADKLDLKKNVVRVWFCNQRQKQKRMKFSAFNGENMM
uniref:POU domain, class 4, transcription factor 3-like n=1 Tax=Styela clava TaxID=7725 RepID=UPI001939380A|nr:POU domain, class 4, transcription factor 3-like [Styela clava]